VRVEKDVINSYRRKVWFRVLVSLTYFQYEIDTDIFPIRVTDRHDTLRTLFVLFVSKFDPLMCRIYLPYFH
jgi:hypothetical protein